MGRKGSLGRLENALSAYVHKMIFRRWVLGVVPGSQFLANLLIAWEHLGYFKVKHLEQPMKSMYLLVSYARSDGVPDRPTKDKGTGWYRLVQRELASELKGC